MHLTQQNLTNDGNHQLNQYRKRRDRDDHSFWEGDGYFPSETELRMHLQKAEGNVEVKLSVLKLITGANIVAARNPRAAF